MNRRILFSNGMFGTKRKTALVLDFVVYQQTADMDGHVAVVYAETQNGRTTLCELSLGTFNEEFTHTVEEH